MCVTQYHLNKITYVARKFKFKSQLHCKLIVQPSVYCLNCVNLPFLIYGMKNNTFPPHTRVWKVLDEKSQPEHQGIAENRCRDTLLQGPMLPPLDLLLP